MHQKTPKTLKKPDFVLALALIETAKRKRLADHEIDGWYELASMQSWPIEAWRAAAVKLAYDPIEWPRFDQLADLAREHVLGMTESAGEAWERILAASKVWYRGCDDSCRKANAMLSEAERAAVKRLGGFTAIQETPSDTMGVIRGQFRKLWEQGVGEADRLANLPEVVRPVSAEVKRLAETMSTERLEQK